MDTHDRLDELAKNLARGLSRRQILGGILSAIGLSVLGQKPARAQNTGDIRLCGVMGGYVLQCYNRGLCCFWPDGSWAGCGPVMGCPIGTVPKSPCDGPGQCPSGELCDRVTKSCLKQCPSGQEAYNGECLPSGKGVCNKQIYDKAKSCCVEKGIVSKNPIVDLADCPQRHQHPGLSSASTNGCTKLNHWGKANFSSCCNDLQVCYMTCNSDESQCNHTFKDCMISACNDAYPHVSSISDKKYNACKNGPVRINLSDANTKKYNTEQHVWCDCC